MQHHDRVGAVADTAVEEPDAAACVDRPLVHDRRAPYRERAAAIDAHIAMKQSSQWPGSAPARQDDDDLIADYWYTSPRAW